MTCGKTLLRLVSRRAAALVLPALMLVTATAMWATATATTTTLTTGSKTVNTRTITTLTAQATATGASTPIATQGLFRFYDGKVLLGTAQNVTTGTKYTRGSGYLSVELGPGTHSITAVYAGTTAYASSTSAASSVVIGGGTTATTISSSGSAGAYTLTGTVTATGATAVTGNMNFIDQTDSNTTIGTAPLGSATAKRSYTMLSPVLLYNPSAGADDFRSRWCWLI